MKKNRDNEQMAINGTDEADILARLGERVEKAIAVIGELRRERDTLRTRLDELEARLKDHEGTSERLSTLEEERGDVRSRIESILASLESLDTPESEQS